MELRLQQITKKDMHIMEALSLIIINQKLVK